MIRRRLNRILSVIVCVSFSMVAFGQNHFQPHVFVGGHGGVAMSRMSFSPEVPQSWAMGPVVGAHIHYTEEKLFGIVGELNLVQRGWKENFDDESLKFTRTLTYITLPVMTRISFGSDRTKAYINLGPEFGLMVADSKSANFDLSTTSFPSTRRINQMRMKVKNKFDYGITVGAGCEFFVNPRNSVNVECRFYYGLGNIFPSSKADEFGASRNMSLNATIGYSFRIK